MESNTSCQANTHYIKILNFEDGESVCHSVVIVEGKITADCKCSADRKVTVEYINGPWGAPSTTYHNLTKSQHFKCLLKLEHGINRLILKHGVVKLNFTLNFHMQDSNFVVLPVYIVCKGHDGRFQAPEQEDNSIDSACDRIDIGIRLIQSILAEQLRINGYGRQTFHLQSDVDFRAPHCHVFYSQTTVEQAHAADMNALWEMFAREIMQSPLGKKNHKFVAFLSCTHYEGRVFSRTPPSYDDIISCTKGHVALGGGGLALFGTGCLHTWASSIEEVTLRFSSVDPVDTALFMDDSNYRGTYGGCYSTTLGAVCHEIGHIFDLGHTSHGIMGPGYHNLRSFLLPEITESKQRPSLPDRNSKITQIFNEPLKTDELARELTVTWNKMDVSTQSGCFDPDTIIPENELLQSIEGSSHVKRGSNTDLSPATNERSISHEECQQKYAPQFESNMKPAFDSLDKSPMWTQSCLGLLAYNKWINPNATLNEPQTQKIDTTRNQIISKHSLRFIELRDKNSKSILHWRFPESSDVNQFIIPKQYLPSEAICLCIIDSVGNFLKVDLHISN